MGGKQINIMEAIVDVIKELQREESEDVYTVP